MLSRISILSLASLLTLAAALAVPNGGDDVPYSDSHGRPSSSSVIASVKSTATGGASSPPPTATAGWNLKNFKSLVAFGDSYTDETRLNYFAANNGSAPPVGWIEPTTNGSYTWARYVNFYTGANLYDYAVSGAVCSNDITPRWFSSINANFPDVKGYEIPAFLADAAYVTPAGQKFLDIPADETVYAVWDGTNDVGDYAFLTDSQVPGTTLTTFLDCIYDQLDRLYASGARYFVLMNLNPLNLVAMYQLETLGGVKGIHANQTETHGRMLETVTTVNDVYKYRTPYELLVANRYPQAKIALFDNNRLFTDMWDNPTQYLNGSAPANVTGFINHVDAQGNAYALPSPDSFLWRDALHPSEQADRNLAKEFVNVVKGTSKYATYWG